MPAGSMLPKMSDVSMMRASRDLDMLYLHEVPQGLPGVLGFLMARQGGPPTMVQRPPLNCYLLGIGLNVSTIRINANGRTLRQGTYGLHGVHLVQPNQDANYYFTGKLVNFRLRLSGEAVAASLEQMDIRSAGVELTDMAEQFDKVLGSLSNRLIRESLSHFPDLMLIDDLMQTLVDRVVVLNASQRIRPRLRESLSSSALNRVMDYIKQCHMQEIRLLQLAEIAGLSRSHFLRGFRRSVGSPPHAFITMYRLQRAGEMIYRTKLTFADIAAATGFSSHAHMTSTFRQWIGFSPSELRAPERYGLPQTVAFLTP
jgi:AraC family transcriptional regulator